MAGDWEAEVREEGKGHMSYGSHTLCTVTVVHPVAGSF